MINATKSKRLLSRLNELTTKASFDLGGLKKGLLLDPVSFRWRSFCFPLCLMRSRGLNAASLV